MNVSHHRNYINNIHTYTYFYKYENHCHSSSCLCTSVEIIKVGVFPVAINTGEPFHKVQVPSLQSLSLSVRIQRIQIKTPRNEMKWNGISTFYKQRFLLIRIQHPEYLI